MGAPVWVQAVTNRKTKTEILDHATLKRDVIAAQKARRTASWNDGNGLKLVVTKAGRARFVHRFAFRNRTPEKWYSGEFPHEISLSEARRMRDADRALIEAGKNPLTVEADALVTPTLEAFCKAHFHRLAPLGERHDMARSTWWRDMSHRVGNLRRLPINDIRLTDVETAVRPYWQGETATPTAERIVGRISRAIELWHALERPDDDEWQNPVSMKRLKRRLGDAAHVETHRASLPFADMPALVAELRRIDTMTARLAEFTVLTGTRAKEGRGATWSEIDWRERVWRVPAARMKGRKEHIVPLSLGAVKVLRRAARGMPCKPGDPIFPNLTNGADLADLRTLSAKPATDLMRRLRPGITLHGCRSSLVAWGVAVPHRRQGPFELQLMDKCLAHIKVKDHDQLSAAIRAYSHNAGVDPFLARRRVVAREWSVYLDGRADAAPVRMTPPPARPALRLAA